MKAVAALYEWDDTKRAANLAKHGVDFASIYDFDWNMALVADDVRKTYGELRQIALGRIGARVHVLVFTRRRDKLRVISLRKANREEVAYYEQS